MAEISSVNQTQISDSVESAPPKPIEVLRDKEEDFIQLQNEATAHGLGAAIARNQLGTMAVNSPDGFSFNSGVDCSGVGLTLGSVGAYETAYLAGPSGGGTPSNGNTRVEGVTSTGGTETVLVFQNQETTNRDALGRVGGYNGWGKRGDIISGGLASFDHNWEAMILGYGERPSLPNNNEWQLPNVVVDSEIASRESQVYNTSIEVPKQLAPSASYTYSTAPSPIVRFNVLTEAPEESRAYFQIWNQDKEQILLSDELTFPKGETETVFVITGTPLSINSGYFNINPSFAPEGMTITGVDTFPPGLL